MSMTTRALMITRSLVARLEQVEEGGRGREQLLEKLERKVSWLEDRMEGRLVGEHCVAREQVRQGGWKG